MFVTTLFTLLFLLIATNNHQISCFNLHYPSFPQHTEGYFERKGTSYIVLDALQVTADVKGQAITNQSGWILYKKRFRLWNKKKTATFNSTFVMNISPQAEGGGEGLAFILTKDNEIPDNSHGQWLGIVNATTNGSSEAKIVAVEFDTKKSFRQDIDGNHVGLNVNSVYSKVQVSLNGTGITIANSSDITAMVLYNGKTKTMNVSVFKGNHTGSIISSQVFSIPIDLRQILSSKVYLGFSASTGTSTELNCVKSWYFNGESIEGKSWKWIVISSVVIAAISVCGFVGYMFWMKKYQVTQVSGDGPTIQGIETGLGPKKIKLKDLKTATGNFNAKNELGRGGFGIVYKGSWDGNEVAVKRIINTPQGKQNLIAEVTTIGSLHHKNLVKLIGWCYESDELLLAYEYMPNRSLDKFIYVSEVRQGRGIMENVLSWERRHGIIYGVAQALDYLHNECSKRVLHRDVKASNIMLDSEFNAYLGDFGLARMFKLSEKTHHSTKEIAGTPGYMAPEIFHTGRTTAESDVYSFGVLSLVVACGKRPGVVHEDGDHINSIVDWVWDFYKLELTIDAIDPRIKGRFDKEQAEFMLVLGLACCHPNPYMRPSMRTALQVLIGEASPPLVPFDKPVFMWPVTAPSFNRDESTSGGILTPYSSLSGR